MTPQEQHSAALGMGFVAMSAATISTGMVGGLAFLPFLIAEDIHYTQHHMEAANVGATLGDTYEYAYGRSFDSVPASGSTGQIFRDMKGATKHFRAVLEGHGVASPENYVLTALRTADTVGYTLYALANRPEPRVRVRDINGRIVVLTPANEAYYRAYQTDASGRPFDTVIDWAGVERRSISTQKGQAILLTLAANSVLINRRSNDYWQIAQRWRSGDYARVVAERRLAIEQRLG